MKGAGVPMAGRLLLPGALFLAACAALFGRPLLPEGEAPGDSIRVPHAVHKKAQVECIACHEEIYDARTLEGSFLPPERKCLECHGEKKEKGECGFCHTDVKRAAPWAKREPRLRMGHAQHIDLVKEDCSRCHKVLPDPLRPAHAAPPMSACTECHAHKVEYKEARCQGCHLDLSRYPLKPVSVFSHQGDYVRRHGKDARSSADTCARCHEQTFCADCHASTVSTRIEVKFPERADRDFIHRDDFLGRHSIEANADPATCLRCHGQSFCESCHRAQNLSPRSDNPRNPHPPGFSIPASPQFHGPAARRDIGACASCHDQGPASNCVQCHRVGGIGGNPHPPAWLQQHDRDEIHRNGMCRYCH